MKEFTATKDVRNIPISNLHVSKDIYRNQEQLLVVLSAWIKCLKIDGHFTLDEQWPYTPYLYNGYNYAVEVDEKGDEYLITLVEHKEFCILTCDQVIPLELPVEIM